MKFRIFFVSILITIIMFSTVQSQGRFCQDIFLTGAELPSTMPFTLQFNIPNGIVYDRGYNAYYENSAPGSNDVSVVVISDVFILDLFTMSGGSGSHINSDLAFPDDTTIYINFDINTGAPPSTTIDVFQFQICSSINYNGGGNADVFMALDSYPTPQNGVFAPFLYAIGQFGFLTGLLMLIQAMDAFGGYND